jgi:hypothetical protein
MVELNGIASRRFAPEAMDRAEQWFDPSHRKSRRSVVKRNSAWQGEGGWWS